MLWFYESFFPVLWIVFLIYWQVKAFNTKSTQRLEPVSSRIIRVLVFLIVIILLSTTWIPLPWLYVQLWPVGLWPFWLGAAVTIAGLLFAVWAREHLGRNWSRSVTIKQDHELITSGPYAVVRHPGYVAGIQLCVGIALCLGSLWALIPAGLATALLILRTCWEDQTLQAELPGYKEYTQRVQYKLVPGVW